MAVQPWRKAIVTRIEDASHNTKRFWLQIPELESFDFEPGQFVTLDLPIHEKVNRRWRSYSIASAPNGTNEIELVIVLNEKGLGTPYLFSQIKVGDELTVRGPQGVYTLRKPIEQPLVMVCTGTGIAPFRSMINHIVNNKIEHQSIHLIFGCRTKADLLYFDEFTELAKQVESIHYYPVLSREPWHGKKGYVHPVYEEVGAANPNAIFYLCGWKGMVDEARKNLAAQGFDKKQIQVELYG